MPRRSLIQVRRGTSAQWATADAASSGDPGRLLADGEPGRDITTGMLKIGDGETMFADLPGYLDEAGLASTIDQGDASLRAGLLAPLVTRLVAGEALRLGISSSSTFRGHGLATVDGPGYQCWSRVLARYGNTTSTIHNRGMSGARTADLLAGHWAAPTDSAGAMMSAEAAVRTHRLDAIIVNINHNDGALQPPLSAKAYGENMRRVYLACRRAGALVLVVPPLAYGPYWTESWGEEYRLAVYRAAAEAGAVIFPIEKTLVDADGTGADPSYYQSDQLHPTAAGAAKYAAAFAALWPAGLPAGSLSSQGIGTVERPVVRRHFCDWTTELGEDMRTTRYSLSDEYDGRDARYVLGVPAPVLLRNTLFAFDGRKDLQQDGWPFEVSRELTGVTPTSADGVVRVPAPLGSRVGFSVGRAGGARDVTVRAVITGPAAGGSTIASRSSTLSIVVAQASGTLSVTLGGTTTSGIGPDLRAAGPARLVTVTHQAGSAHAEVYVDGRLVGTAAAGSALVDHEADWVVRSDRESAPWVNVADCWVHGDEEAAWYADVARSHFDGLG